MATFRSATFRLLLEGDLAVRAGYRITVEERDFIGTSQTTDRQWISSVPAPIEGIAQFASESAYQTFLGYATALPPTAGTLTDDYGTAYANVRPWVDQRPMRAGPNAVVRVAVRFYR